MKNKIKRAIAAGMLLAVLGSTNILAATHVVQSGDTYWRISQRYNVKLDQLMKVNNATESSILHIGTVVTVPDGDNFVWYEVKSGDTPWLLSRRFGVTLDGFLRFNGLHQNSVIQIGQKLKAPIFEPTFSSPAPTPQTPSTPTQPSAPQSTEIKVTYITHTVQSGDNFWNLGIKYGVPMAEILKANNATQSTMLFIGQKILIPVYEIPVLPVPGPQFGEYQDWWKAAQYLIPIGAQFKVIDFYTGRSFMAQRTTGANHADVETLTAADTEIMRSIWGGTFSWTTRPAIIEYNGRRIAASVAGMPHAGNDNAPAEAHTTWRSDNYGAGPNYDYIKGNNMHGHFDIHFLNSTRHNDGRIDDRHQQNIRIAAGMN